MPGFDMQHLRSRRAGVAVDDRQAASRLPEPGIVPVAGLIAGGSPLRRRAPVDDPLGGTEVSGDVEAELARSRGAGRPLPEAVAGRMGAAMGADLSGVRVHDNPDADRLSRNVQALAFTRGSDMYFSSGAFAPSTPTGQHLLAHELAHAVQSGSGGGSVSRSVIGRADDQAEVAADRVADETLAALRRSSLS